MRVFAGVFWLVLALTATLGFKTNAAMQGKDLPLSMAPFSIEKEGPFWWIRSPEGRKFFSRGVCCVDQGASRESFDPENPSYAFAVVNNQRVIVDPRTYTVVQVVQ